MTRMTTRGVCSSLAVLGTALAVAGAVVPAASARTAPRCDGVRATIVGHGKTTVGTRHRDVIVASGTIRGRGGNDLICGRGTPDHINGGAGDDVLFGRSGADVLVGGKGDDRLRGGADHTRRRDGHVFGADTLNGGPGDDRLDAGLDPYRHPDSGVPSAFEARDTITYAGSTRPVVVDLSAGTATGEGHDTITAERDLRIVGSSHDDHLTGSDLPEWLDGGHGADVEQGGGGRDGVISSDAAHDELSGGDGGDAVLGSPADSLDGDAGDDVLGDYLTSTWVPAANGSADGGTGDDTIAMAGPRNVIAHLDLGAGTFGWGDVLLPVSGLERVNWFGQALVYHGTDGPDQLVASSAFFPTGITAFMLGGDDTVVGTSERDYLDGGPGDDSVDGRGGEGDVCVQFEEGSC
jgi:Ca2+-binding RTX toxin-like protein